MSDDDWFESAFEDEADADAADDPVSDEEVPEDDETDAFEEDEIDSFEDGDSGGSGGIGADPFDESDAPDADPFDGAATEGDSFETDRGSFESGGSVSGTDETAEFADTETDDPFSSDSDPAASGEAEGSGSLFDDDFASAMRNAGPGDGGDSDDFGDEDFETEIPRIDLGISGLDDMIQGGVPERHLMVAIGAPGTGKTTFGLQFLYHGLRQGDNAVFITLEQSRRAILDTANERGWEFDRYEREDSLAIVDLDPVEMANSLDNIRGELPQLIQEFDAERLVLDSVSLLEMMYDDQSKRRTEVFDFTRSLKEAGVTTMLVSEASEDNPYASRHGIIEYLTDAVFVLQYVRGDTQETRLAIEIQKIRNANHSRATKPYDITLDGIDVYQQASIF